MLSGRYRTDSLAAKWLGGNGSCTLPGCQFPIGNLEHLLSGDCLPLRETMCLAVKRGLSCLAVYPLLLDTVCEVLKRTNLIDWMSIILDPSPFPEAIVIAQNYGSESIWPLFPVSRTILWQNIL